MADFWEQWSATPSENIGAPPTAGAGESKMPFDLITDTFRVVMSASRQLGNRIGAVKDMAYQANNAVSINGGQINSGVDINAEAIKRGEIALNRIPAQLVGKAADNLTTAFKQTLYNWIYPVGRVMLWHSNDLGAGSGLLWPGVTATWSIVANSGNRFIVSAGSVGPAQGAGSQVPGTTLGTSSQPNHTHGGSTIGATLDASHIPALVKDGYLAGGGSTNVVENYSFSGIGVAHAHGINADGAHGHTVGQDPARYAFNIIVRTA